MKKCLAVAAALFLLAACLYLPAQAASKKLVEVLMSTPGTTVDAAEAAQSPTADDLDDALRASSVEIAPGAKLTPGRMTLLGTGNVSSEEPDFWVSFKVWSTLERSIGLFFRADGEADWMLLAANLGDVIESAFPASGTYAIAVGW